MSSTYAGNPRGTDDESASKTTSTYDKIATKITGNKYDPKTDMPDLSGKVNAMHPQYLEEKQVESYIIMLTAVYKCRYTS
jgi:hypothetical protein